MSTAIDQASTEASALSMDEMRDIDETRGGLLRWMAYRPARSEYPLTSTPKSAKPA